MKQKERCDLTGNGELANRKSLSGVEEVQVRLKWTFGESQEGEET